LPGAGIKTTAEEWPIQEPGSRSAEARDLVADPGPVHKQADHRTRPRLRAQRRGKIDEADRLAGPAEQLREARRNGGLQNDKTFVK